jgi:iron-sulfur cluster assembly accessory protein
MDQTIQLSEKARRRLEELGVKHPSFLRLWIAEGGCSGFTYQAAVDEAFTPFDRVLFEDEGLKVVTDRGSEPYLTGLYIDYSDDLVRAGFKFRNPNAARSCGCGASFRKQEA